MKTCLWRLAFSHVICFNSEKLNYGFNNFVPVAKFQIYLTVTPGIRQDVYAEVWERNHQPPEIGGLEAKLPAVRGTKVRGRSPIIRPFYDFSTKLTHF